MNRALGVLASLLRMTAAAALVWVCWQDWPAQQARDAFEQLPPYDAAAEASALLKQERISEALLLIDEALAQDPQNTRLIIIKQGLEAERKSWMRQLALGGRGALTGRGTDSASLTGAIVADLFVFGDVRDLVIQSGQWLRGEETDELIVALSAGGILLTVSPSVDLGAALLKFARRMGAVSDAFARSVAEVARQALRQRRADAVSAITDDVAALASRAKPAGAVAILKHVDDPATLRLAARFSEKPDGLRALLLDPATTMRWLKSGWPHAEAWLLKAARKGRAGLDYLAQNSSMMFRGHPLLGFVKGLYKGNIPDWLLTLARGYSQVILGLAAGWFGYEVMLLIGRALGPGVSGRARPPPELMPAG
jgi:hypothetical protein